MPPRNFNDIVKDLRSQVNDLAGLTVRNYRKEAARDARKMITAMKKDLRRWSDLLEQGALTTEDFEWLVVSQSSSLKMSALQKAGLASMRINHFKSSVFNMMIDTVFDSVLGPAPTS